MERLYSEGLGGEKSSGANWVLVGVNYVLIATCSLQRSNLGQPGFSDSYQLPYSLAIRKLSESSGGKPGLCIARAELCLSKAGTTEGEVLGFSIACDSEVEDLILVIYPVYFGNTKLLLVTTCRGDADWSSSLLTFSLQYATCLNG